MINFPVPVLEMFTCGVSVFPEFIPWSISCVCLVDREYSDDSLSESQAQPPPDAELLHTQQCELQQSIFKDHFCILTLSFSFVGSASLVISPDVSALVVSTGDPVTLHCSGKSKVEWQTKKDVFSNDTSSTLSIPKTTYRDTGTYVCAYVNSSDKSIATVHLFVRGNHASLFQPTLAEEPHSRVHGHYTAPFYGCGCVCVWGPVQAPREAVAHPQLCKPT